MTATTGWPVHVYLLALALLVAVAAAAGSFAIRRQVLAASTDAAYEQAVHVARIAATEVTGDLDKTADAAAQLAASPTVGAAVGQVGECVLSFSGTAMFDGGHIDFLRPDGGVACSSAVPGAGGRTYAGAPWLQNARGGPVLGGPVPDPATGRPAAVVAAPAGAGVVVAIFLDLGGLGPALATRYGGPDGLEFLLTTTDGGQVLSRSIDPDRWSGRPVPRKPYAVGSGREERRDVDGRARLYAQAAVPGSDWVIHVGADQVAAYAAADRLFRPQLWIVAAGLVVFLIGLAIVYRRITRPIRALGAAVRATAAEPGAHPLRVNGPAEVTALAQDFNSLLDAVSYQLVERRRAEDAADVSEQRYRLLFEANPLAILVYDTETLRFLEVNDAALRTFGYERAELMAMTVLDVALPSAHAALREVMTGDDDLRHSGPWPCRAKAGDTIEAEITSVAVTFPGSTARLVIAEDVTARRRLESELQQAQRLESLGQLAGGIAHDFNNLLAVILNYAAFVGEALDAALDGEAVSAEARADVRQIVVAAERAAALTGRLLAFARREVVRPEILDPNNVVEEVAQLLQRTIGEDIALKTVAESDLWPVRADPGQLSQVLMNLAVNARDAMPVGGTLTMETGNVDVDEDYVAVQTGLRLGRHVRIRVSDTGTGMTPELVERAFEPFFTTKPKGEGTGLGLATVHGIVAQAGGAVHIYSEMGVGTSISVLLPAIDDDAESTVVHTVVDAESLDGTETVIVVEDEDAIREVTRRILTRHGYQVLTASSGPEAIALCQVHPDAPDLLLTDVVMPQMSGNEIADEVRALYPAIGVLYMSGYAEPILDYRGRLPAGQMLVRKPFTEAELLTAVRVALRAAPTR